MEKTDSTFFTTEYWRASFDSKTGRAIIDLPAKPSLFGWLLPTPSSLHRIEGFATKSDSSIVSFYYSPKRNCTIKNTAGKTKKLRRGKRYLISFTLGTREAVISTINN
jgi:hypothetical protein